MKRHYLLCALLLGLSGVLPGAAEAITFRAGDSVEIPAGTVIADDLYVAGRDVMIRGRVEGDLVVAGGTVTVTGEVRDDLIAAGRDVILRGPVGETIRAAGQEIAVAGSVGRDLILAGSRIEQLASSQVKGSSVLTGQDLAVRGSTVGKLQVSGGDVLIDGAVGGAEVNADAITVTAGARIAGPLTYTSPREVDVRPGATVTGPVTRTEKVATTWHVPSWVGWVFLYLVGALTGVVLALLLPGAVAATSRELRRNPWLSLAAGAGVLFGVPILAVILTITLIGIPLALSLMMFYGLGLYLAWVLAAIAVGDLILGRMPIRSQRGRLGLAALLGVAVLLLLQAIPWIGGLIAVLALMAGFGSAIMALINRLSRGT